MSQFIEDVVKAHNEYRQKHKVDAVKENPKLTAIAQAWADKLAATGVLKHSSNKFNGQPVGENVAFKYGTGCVDYTGQEAVDQWYSESAKYNYTPSASNNGTGHFSQVVWKGSKEIGVGKARSPDGKVFVVVDYVPPGNYIGQHAQNVFPPS